MGTYPIFRGGEQIGKAQVEKRGLYWHFDCRCRLSGEVMYRLMVQWGDKEEKLGIPVPENGEFMLTARIPASRFGAGEPVIRAVPKHSPLTGTFVPISPEEPFGYLTRLEHAVFVRREGQPGLLLRE